MGWAVPDFQGCSLWYFNQFFTGWKLANIGPDKPDAPTPEEHAAMDWDF
ncbi:MAG: hypothetical protein AAGC58_06660 [Asticcacaulis sp.]